MQSIRCKQTHTGLWEYLIALAWEEKGKKRFTIREMVSKVRELEKTCLLPEVSETTIVEQLTSRCCAQGSTSFGSLLNYFSKETEGVYTLFDPKTHDPIPERVDVSNVPTDTIVRHIRRRHRSDIECVLKHLDLSPKKLPLRAHELNFPLSS